LLRVLCGLVAGSERTARNSAVTAIVGDGAGGLWVGTGLGLNIAYNLVTTLLQGTIRVESQPGRGTAFILDLPLRAVAESPRGQAQDQGKA